MRRLRILTTLLLLLSWNHVGTSALFAEDRAAPVIAALFGEDEAVLADNLTRVIERTVKLSADERFEQLTQWVLPSPGRSSFRMNAKFLQTDAIPGSLHHVADATCEGILSPCFALVRTAEKSGRLDELRQRIEAIPDPTMPHQLRAKLAMLLIVQCAQGNQEQTAAL